MKNPSHNCSNTHICPKCGGPLKLYSESFEFYVCEPCEKTYNPDDLEAISPSESTPKESLPGTYDIFVGRNDNIDTLWRAWRDTNNTSKPIVVVLEGQPGVGKSAVVEEFYRQVASDVVWDAHDYWPDVPGGRLDAMSDPTNTEDKWKECSRRLGKNRPKFMWYAARCGARLTSDGSKAKSIAGSHLDLAPWVSIANGFKVHKPLSDTFPSVALELVKKVAGRGAVEAINTVMPFFGHCKMLADALRDKFGDQGRRVEREFGRLEDEVMSRINMVTDTNSKGFPTIISLDDIQWAPGRSLDFLLQLLSKGNRRLLVIATARDVDIKAEGLAAADLLRQFERRNGDEFNYVNQTIGQLTAEAVTEQVTKLFGGNPDESLRKWIVAKSDGLPLFADCLCRHLVAAGYATVKGAFFTGKSVSNLEDDWMSKAIPHDATGVISERLERLEKSHHDIYTMVCRAALQGREFDDHWVRKSFAGINEHDLSLSVVHDKLEVAEKSHAILNSADELDADDILQYAYTHSSLHEACRDQLKTHKTVELYRLLASYCNERLESCTDFLQISKYAGVRCDSWSEISKASNGLRGEEDFQQAFNSSIFLAKHAQSVGSHDAVLEDIHDALRYAKNYCAAHETSDIAQRYLSTVCSDWLAKDFHERRDNLTADKYHQMALSAAKKALALSGLVKNKVFLCEKLLSRATFIKECKGAGQRDVLIEATVLANEAFKESSSEGVLNVVNCQITLADDMRDSGEMDEAEQERNQAVLACEKAKENDDADFIKDAHAIALEDLARSKINRGDVAGARENFEAYVQMRRQLHESIDTAESRDDLSNALSNLGDFLKDNGNLEAAGELYREMLELRLKNHEEVGTTNYAKRYSAGLWEMASYFNQCGDSAQAKQYFEESVQMDRQLDDSIETPESRGNLSNALSNLGDFLKDNGDLEAAGELYREMLELRRKNHEEVGTTDYAKSYSVGIWKLASYFNECGDSAEAKQYFEESVQMDRQLDDSIHTPESRNDLSYALRNFGDFLKDNGDLEAAGELYREMLELRRKNHEDVGTTDYAKGYSLGLWEMASYFNECGDSAQAKQYFEEYLQVGRQLHDSIETPDSRNDLSYALSNLGDFLKDNGDLEAAGELYREMLELRRKNHEEVGTTVYAKYYSVGLWELASYFNQCGDSAQAKQYFEEYLQVLRQLDDSIHTPDSRNDLSDALSNLGDFLRDNGDLEAAGELYRETLELRTENVQESSSGEYMKSLGSAHYTLCDYHLLVGDLGQYDIHQSQLEKSFANLVEHTDSPSNRLLHADSFSDIGIFQYRQGKLEEARASFERSTKMISQLRENHPATNCQELAGSISRSLGILELCVGDNLAACRSFEEYLENATDEGDIKAFAESYLAFARYNLGDAGTARTLIASAIATINDNSAKNRTNRQKVRCAAAFAVNSIIFGSEMPKLSCSAREIYPVEQLIFTKRN